MIDTDAIEAESSLLRIQKVCKVLNILMKVVFAIVCACWIFVMGSMLVSLTTSWTSGTVGDVGVANLLLCLAYGAIIAVMFFAFVGVFSDVSKGATPFTLKQVKRLRLIAILLVVYALLDFVITYNSVLFQMDTLNSGYVSTSGSAIVTVNFAPLIAAAVVFAFSFVFKYGVLLQEFSDDTV